MQTTEPLMTTQDLADYIQMPIETIYKWRRLRKGPVGIRVGRHIRFRRQDVDAWLASQRDPQPA